MNTFGYAEHFVRQLRMIQQNPYEIVVAQVYMAIVIKWFPGII